MLLVLEHLKQVLLQEISKLLSMCFGYQSILDLCKISDTVLYHPFLHIGHVSIQLRRFGFEFFFYLLQLVVLVTNFIEKCFTAVLVSCLYVFRVRRIFPAGELREYIRISAFNHELNCELATHQFFVNALHFHSLFIRIFVRVSVIDPKSRAMVSRG